MADHVRCHFFPPLFCPFCVSLALKWVTSEAANVNREAFLFSFPPLQHVLYSNLNLLLLENDSGEKLLLCWIIQTSSFRGVCPPQHTHTHTKSGQRQWAMWTISASQSTTPRKTQPLIVHQSDGRDWGDERREKSWYFIPSEWEEGQSWTEQEDKKWLLSFFLSPDEERWGIETEG